MSRLASTGSLPAGMLRRTPGRPRGIRGLWFWVHALLGRFHLQGGTPLLDAVLDSALDARPARFCLGLIGVTGFPLYYVVWTYVVPQPYESLLLRLLFGALFIPFLLPTAWLEPLRRFWPWYWHGTLLLALPFFFTFMALQNDTTAWALSYVTALLFTLMLAPPLVGLTQLAIGTMLALLCHYLRHGQLQFEGQLIVQGWPVVLFAIAGSLVTHVVLAQYRRKRTEALLSVAGFVAHELRTPLTAIDLHVKGVEADPTSLTHRLPGLARETHRAHVFIDMLLTSIQPAHTLHREQTLSGAVQISRIVGNAVQRYPYANDRQRRAVKVDLRNDFPVEGVEILLEHMVLNLIKNAFTHGGGRSDFQILITTELRGDVNVLVISDNGRGIAESDLSRVLARFCRGSGSSASLGSGLGLSFCLDVMHSLGGELEVESPRGEGVRTRLLFPLVEASQHKAGS